MDIKSVIRKYGFTVNSLATKHGVGQSRLNQMVNGNPSAKNLEWLASLIGCSPAEFFADWQGAGAEQPSSDGHVDDVVEQSQVASGAGNGIATIKDYGGDADLPFNNNQPKEKQQEAPRQAEAVMAVRFTYECPKCGERMKVCISAE